MKNENNTTETIPSLKLENNANPETVIAPTNESEFDVGQFQHVTMIVSPRTKKKLPPTPAKRRTEAVTTESNEKQHQTQEIEEKGREQKGNEETGAEEKQEKNEKVNEENNENKEEITPTITEEDQKKLDALFDLDIFGDEPTESIQAVDEEKKEEK